MKNESALIPFEGTGIRKVWHEEQWFFSVVDIIAVLTDSKDPQQYWKRLNQRDEELKGTVQIVPLLLETAGGKQKVLCTNTQGILRIVMSVPSPKAEPLKLWMAQVSTERIQETENPELLTERQAELYRAKGYTEEWIARRIQTIETRKALTDEWKNRGVKEGQEYSILTAEIAKGTFGLTPSEHGQLKGLEKQNLRDHMTPLELIFVALGEEVTRRVTIRDDAQGFNENHESAINGGRMANSALQRLESELGEKVVSESNFLNLMGDKNKTNTLESGEKE
jgi:prophage antirepressor-like protein